MIDRRQALAGGTSSTTASARRGTTPPVVGPTPPPLSMRGQAALRAVEAAKAQFGGVPGMDRFFAQPGMSAANPAPPVTTMHSGQGTPGLRQAYLSLLSGQQTNPEIFGRAPGASLRDMRAIYGGSPSIGDASQLRYIAPLIGLQHIYSGHGSGQY
jgi:hypothetical protein